MFSRAGLETAHPGMQKSNKFMALRIILLFTLHCTKKDYTI
jgi:hypothetical protein